MFYISACHVYELVQHNTPVSVLTRLHDKYLVHAMYVAFTFTVLFIQVAGKNERNDTQRCHCKKTGIECSTHCHKGEDCNNKVEKREACRDSKKTNLKKQNSHNKMCDKVNKISLTGRSAKREGNFYYIPVHCTCTTVINIAQFSSPLFHSQAVRCRRTRNFKPIVLVGAGAIPQRVAHVRQHIHVAVICAIHSARV